MQTKRQPSFMPFFLISLLMFVTGWGGLAILFVYTLPTLGPRWLFFFFLTMAVTSAAIPLVYFFNRRFPSAPPADGSVVIRQAMWFGLYASLLCWLQIGRVLKPTMAIFIAIAFGAIEFFLRLLERSLWKPREAENE
jgi:hypothetical protein